MREMRFKFVGTLFYLAIVINLLLTGEGVRFIRKTFDILKTSTSNSSETSPSPKTRAIAVSNNEVAGQAKPEAVSTTPVKASESTTMPSNSTISIIAALLSVSALLFTSDAMGYLFSSIVVWCCESKWGPYSTELRNLKEKYNEEIQQQYLRFSLDPNGRDKYRDEVIHNYFWQRAPTPLVEWCVRRDSAFLIGNSVCFGILFGLILSVLLISWLKMTLTTLNCWVVGISLIFVGVFWWNARRSFKESCQMVDLWYLEH